MHNFIYNEQTCINQYVYYVQVVENTTSTIQNTDVTGLPKSSNLVDFAEEQIEINEEDRGSEPPSLEATEGSDRSRRIKIPRPYSPQENLRLARDGKKLKQVRYSKEMAIFILIMELFKMVGVIIQ